MRISKTKTYKTRNKAGKLVSMFFEQPVQKWIVGVQGTNEWYSYQNPNNALLKFKELENSDIV